MAINYAKILSDAIGYLGRIPAMRYILSSVPKNVRYKIVGNLPGMACYESDINTLSLNAQIFIDDMTPKHKLLFLTTLAHELCHASQKTYGLGFSDLSTPSFGETFRVSRMTEIEAILLEVIVENELLQRAYFADCDPSSECLFYQILLRQTNGNVQQANRRFILAYWKNSVEKIKGNAFVQSFKTKIDHHYHYYIEQAYHHSVVMHKYGFKPTNTTLPVNAINKYFERMGVCGMNPEVFLQNGFDNIETAVKPDDGVTVFDCFGDKKYNYSPTANAKYDKITYFKDGVPDKVFIKNNATQERDDITVFVIGLQKLETAIKDRNMNVVKQTFLDIPSIINAQKISDGDFPLLMAIRNNNSEAVAFILNKQPNLLLTDVNGRGVLSELDKLTNRSLRDRLEYLYVQQIKAHIMGGFVPDYVK